VSISVLIFVLFVLLLGSAFFSAAETALFSLSPFSIRSYRESPNLKQRLVAQLMDRPRDCLVTILILNMLANILIQNTVSSIVGNIPDWTLKVGVPFLLTVVFGEVLPKSIAMANNTRLAPPISPTIHFFMRVFKPVRPVLNSIASFLSRMLCFFIREEKEVSFEELRHVVKTSFKSGVVNEKEAELIEGALDLKEATVKELMRPRDEVLFYDLHDPLTQLLRLFTEEECTRVPVSDGPLERVMGILSTRRFFFHQEKIKEGADLIPFLKKPIYVPESMRAFALLQHLRGSEEEMAIVVDEYGSVSGLITQEDLIERVVGEIRDRRDVKSLYTRSGPDVIIASGKLELSLFEDIFGIPLETKENVVTLGGWLIEQLGDIPVAGTKYATDDFLFYVLAADPNRIRRIYVRKTGQPGIGKKK
jgi:CBS domain containing-hemolysin-like protein